MKYLPEINMDFFIRLGLGLLLVSAGIVVFALLYLVPYIGIALILIAVLAWVLVLGYKLGNAILGPSVWQREAIERPSDYIRRLTRDDDDNDSMQDKKLWFYPSEFDRAMLETTFERGKGTTAIETLPETNFEEMRFDIDKIIATARARAIPAEYCHEIYDEDEANEPESH